MANRVISAILTLQDRDFSSNLRRASDRSDDFGRGIVRVGNKIERFGKGAVNVFKTVGAGAAALGGAGVAALGAGVAKSIFDMDEAFSTLQAQTGATAEQMEVYGSAAKDVFKKGYGENIDEVTNALARVKQNMHNIDDGELSNVTSKAMLLGKTFDSDVNEVTRGTNNMMEAFGISADKAFDLFTAGGQRGLNFSNEMFDNVAEYSSLFGAMGYSAEEYFGIMERGAKAGVYNLDYVNDVMKEFQIRIKDGSKSTDETFSAMSKSTFDLWEAFNRGEATVADVAGAVTKELEGMDDKVEANQLAVALFGTKFEDLEAKGVYAMLGAKDAMTGFEGATDNAAAKVEGSLKNRLVSSWRELQVGIADVVNGAGAQEFLGSIAQKADELVPKIQGIVEKAFEFGNTVRENWGPIKETLIGVGTAVGVVAAGMGTLKVIQTVTTMVQGFRTAMGLATAGQWAMNTAMLASPLTWVVVGIAAVIAIGVALYRNWDTVKAKAGELWAKTTEVFGGIYDWAAQKIQPVTSFFKSLYDKFIDFKNAITSFKPPEWVSKIGGAIGKAAGAVKNFLPSFDVGTNRVASDMTANIHKDEMIIPARQAERIRAAGGTIDNIDQMVQSTPVAVTTPTPAGSTPQPTASNNGGVQVIIQNLNAKGVTAMEVANELVPLLKLRLANL
ncbi:phage tail tape measure protein [Lysinibacillus boronitolerans]|uniref:phage tail tape measure protein n=1 Tax=Lysinibacillus boronitolerans TaxID=309788 RepID=UPI00216335C4|nr:phage tail tape measure protein [Lysinibacillus boronitolerans]MCS1392974.1 phage tail tape measure protein [Lysinibacillus boronitolerans]